MRSVWMFVIGIVVASFQLTLFSDMFDQMVKLDIFFVFLVLWSLARHGEDSFLIAFFGGLYISHYSDIHFGFLSLFYVVLVYIASLMKQDVVEGHFLMVFGVSLLLSAVFELLLLFSFWFGGVQFSLGQYLMGRMIWRIFWHSLIITIMYPMVAKISELYFEKQKSLVS
jgi:rod shape-determining protein MreD